MFLAYKVIFLLLLSRTHGQKHKAVIVTPDALNPDLNPQGDDNNKKDHRAQFKSVGVVSQGSMKQLSETARIRQQFEAAVQSNSYAVTGFQDDPHPPQFDMPVPRPHPPEPRPFGFDFFKFLLGKSEEKKSGGILGASVDEEVGSVQDIEKKDEKLRDFIGSSLNETIKKPGDKAYAGLSVNVVDSELVEHVMGDEGPVIMSNQQYRESLKLVSVSEDSSFTFGNNVSIWYTHNYRGTKHHTLLGITDRSVILILERNGTFEKRQEIILEKPILASTTFLRWNGNQMDKFLVLAVENEIRFMHISATNSTITLVWKWHVFRSVDVFCYYQIDGIDYLLLTIAITNGNTTQYAADIYRFDLGLAQTWLVQKIPLRSKCPAVHFLEMENEYALVFTQNDTVEIYRNSPSTDSSHSFVHLKSVKSLEVQAVACFQIGGLSYVAIGGRTPQILRYHRQQFFAQTIMSVSWGLVEHILPIYARTYRDDLILLVQHRVHFEGGHSVPALEALIWNGVAFVTAAMAVPCFYNGVLVEYGLSFMLDYEREVGIEGASVIQRGTNISLLVPRFEAPSGLFFLAFRLDEVDEPALNEGQSVQRELLEKFNAQTNVLKDAENALVNSINSESEFKADWLVAGLESDVVEVDDIGQVGFEELSFGGQLWGIADLRVNVSGTLAQIEEYSTEMDALESLADSPSVKLSSAGNGQFKMEGARVIREKRDTEMDTVYVEHLQVEYINDVPVNEMVFMDAHGDIDLSGSDVVVANKLILAGEVLVDGDPVVGDAVDENDSGISLHVAGDVNVGTINGIDLNTFLHNVVMTNIPDSIPNMELNGPISFGNHSSVRRLNQLPFPDGYVWTIHSRTRPQITGKKTFTGYLRAPSVDNVGLLDGINTLDVVTLKGRQEINSVITFDSLQVNEQFNVTGKVTGSKLDNILANSNLAETNHVQSNCIFNTLVVEGPIYVDGTIQNVNLDAVFSNIVYKNVSRTQITAFKTFDVIDVDSLQLSSGQINGVPVDDVLTINTEQEISFDKLSGNVIFKELTLNGLFDFVNVTELDENAIRLHGDQFTEAELVFHNPDGFGNDLEANQLNIMQLINDIPIIDLISVDNPLELNGDVEIDSIIIENLDQFDGDLTALGILNGQPLTEIDRVRVSLSRRQEITAPFSIQKASIQGDLNAMQIHGYSLAEIQKSMQTIKKVTHDLSNGEVIVQKLIVEGSVNVTYLNFHDFESIMSNAIWLDRPNTIVGPLNFANPPELYGQFNVNYVNGVPLNDFISGVVRRNDLQQNVVFTQPQVFVNGMQVIGNLDAQHIGNISGGKILNKKTTLVNGLRVTGNVQAHNANVSGLFNGVLIQDISNMYVFDVLRQAHVIRTPKMRFLNPIVVEDLWLRQSTPNITTFLLSIVRKDSDSPTVIRGAKNFHGRLRFQADLDIALLSGIDVNAFMNTVALNEPGVSVTIVGDVSFENHVQTAALDIRGDVMADRLAGVEWTSWLSHGIRTDQSYNIAGTIHLGAGVFRADNVNAVHLNGIAMADVFTTNTAQNFSSSPHFSSVIANGNVLVGGRVNNMDLREERANTVMTLGDQTISTDSRFQTIRVMNTLQTLGPVNGKNLQLIVPLNGDVILSGAFSFSHIRANDLQTSEPISGIDFNHWTRNALLRNADSQIVTANWTIHELNAINVDGSGSVNGMDVLQLSERMLGQSQMIDNVTQKHQKDVCLIVKDVARKSQSLRYTLGHFENVFKVSVETAPINSMLFWMWDRVEYLLINTGCLSIMYQWNSRIGMFEEKLNIDSGAVDEWLSAEDAISRVIVSNSGKLNRNCSRKGLNLWSWEKNALTFAKQIGGYEEYQLNLKQKRVPDYFYALHSKNHSVLEFDLTGRVVDEWKLPAAQEDCEDIGYVFLPDRITTELALSDGYRLSRLSPNKNATSKRFKRCFGEICESLQNSWLQGMGPSTNFTMPGEKDAFNGFFRIKDHTQKLLEPSFSNTSGIKLKMLKLDDPKITWPEFRLADTRAGIDNRNLTIGSTHQSSLDPSELETHQTSSKHKQGSKKTEPETIALASTLDVKKAGSNKTSVNIVLPENTIKLEKLASEAGTHVEKSSEKVANNKESQLRIDIYGEIEKSSKHLLDNVVDAMYGKPQSVVDIGNEDTDDDIETRSSANETSKVSVEENKVTKITAEFTKGQHNQTAGQDRVSSSSEVSGHNKSKPSGSQPRMDLYGSIEKNAKIMTDRIADAMYGKPQSEVNMGNEDEDDDIETRSSTNDDTRKSSSNANTQLNKKKTNQTVELTELNGASSNDTQLQMDLFGKIEKPAKKIIDRLFDRFYGKPYSDESGARTSSDNTLSDSFTEEKQSTSKFLGDMVNRNSGTTLGINKNSISVSERNNILSPTSMGPGIEETSPKTEVKFTISEQLISTQDSSSLSNVEQTSSFGRQSGVFPTTQEPRLSEKPVSTRILTATNAPDTATTSDGNQFPFSTSIPNDPSTHSTISVNVTDPDAPEVGSLLDIIRDVVITFKDSEQLIHQLRGGGGAKAEHHPNGRTKVHHQSNHYSEDAGGNRANYDGYEVGDTLHAPETKIGTAVSTEGGVATAENRFLPGRLEGSEVITLEVGMDHRRTLVAISAWKEDVVRGHQDNIKIYEDVIDGKIFQTINCHRPRSLATMRLRSETILAFLERDAELRLFVYRGIEGFATFTTFTMEAPVRTLQVVALPPAQMHSCRRHFLVVMMATEVRFLEAMMSGHCGLEMALNCDD